MPVGAAGGLSAVDRHGILVLVKNAFMGAAGHA